MSESGLIKLPNGQARVRLDDESEFTIRRPRLGEYKVLREYIVNSPNTHEDDPDHPGQKRRVEGAEGIAIDYQIGWWRLLEDPEGKGRSMVIRGALPVDDSDFDYWMVTGLVQVALFAHWASAPLDLSQ